MGRAHGAAPLQAPPGSLCGRFPPRGVELIPAGIPWVGERILWVGARGPGMSSSRQDRNVKSAFLKCSNASQDQTQWLQTWHGWPDVSRGGAAAPLEHSRTAVSSLSLWAMVPKLLLHPRPCLPTNAWRDTGFCRGVWGAGKGWNAPWPRACTWPELECGCAHCHARHHPNNCGCTTRLDQWSSPSSQGLMTTCDSSLDVRCL